MTPDLKTKLAGRRVVASVSGGKDSAALSLWLTEQGIEHDRVFMDTGWEHEKTYDYLRGDLTRVIGPITEIRGPKTMEELIRSKAMFPSRQRRFCTQMLKVFPMQAYLTARADDGEELINAVGIRAAESAARSRLCEWEWSDGFDAEVWRPLIAWTEAEVIAIHARHGLAPNPLYLLGATRVGCWPCIYARKTEIKLVADTDPARITRLRVLAREENVVLAEMVWDAAEFWWERARQFSHEMDTVSELEAMRIHAILSKLYGKVRGTALATHPGPESQEQAVSHYPECPTPENVETSRAPRGRMEVYSERELLSDIREAGPLLDAHLEPVADPQPATPKVLHLDTALRAEPKAPDPLANSIGVDGPGTCGLCGGLGHHAPRDYRDQECSMCNGTGRDGPKQPAPVPPESVRAEAPAPREPVMCSCGREFDTPQALWDHYVKDGASDEERESHGATTPAPREPCCDLASRGTHRKGCTGEPRSKQIADLTGRVAPLTDAEIVWFRAWKEALPNTGSFWASVEDADRTVDARKEPKP